jgi:uncharacterized protein (DUF302 family)
MESDVFARNRMLEVAHVLAYLVLYFFPYPTDMTAQAQSAAAYPSSVMIFRSRYDFETTLSRLRETLAARGMTQFAEIDQSKAAADVGIALRPTRLFVFGNPKAGTPIMEHNPHAALLLPLKAVVWEDANHVTYLDSQDVTQALEQGFGIDPHLSDPLRRVSALLQAVAGQDPSG